MRRTIVLVMDGCGVGAMPDADDFGPTDPQSATLPHVADAVGGLTIPHLESLGLGNIASISGVQPATACGGWGRMAEVSAGKDSVTGHWEMMGIVTPTPFPTYPHGFPPSVIAEFEARIRRGTLGNVAASGTDILRLLGMEHLATGKPIVYTSADSVFQVAAHEEVISLPDLYEMCAVARAMLAAPHNVQRVIARPFVGEAPDSFRRTPHRRDFPLAPPSENLLQKLLENGKTAQAIGVIADLFPQALFARTERTQTNAESLAALSQALQRGVHDFIFANCEDFDMLYGHRNDPAGFAAALTKFDYSLGGLLTLLRPDDLLLITADHGNDPTTSSTDHAREYVPLMLYNSALMPLGDLGTRQTFADIAATLADWLDIAWSGPGQSCL